MYYAHHPMVVDMLKADKDSRSWKKVISNLENWWRATSLSRDFLSFQDGLYHLESNTFYWMTMTGQETVGDHPAFGKDPSLTIKSASMLNDDFPPKDTIPRAAGWNYFDEPFRICGRWTVDRPSTTQSFAAQGIRWDGESTRLARILQPQNWDDEAFFTYCVLDGRSLYFIVREDGSPRDVWKIMAYNVGRSNCGKTTAASLLMNVFPEHLICLMQAKTEREFALAPTVGKWLVLIDEAEKLDLPEGTFCQCIDNQTFTVTRKNKDQIQQTMRVAWRAIGNKGLTAMADKQNQVKNRVLYFNFEVVIPQEQQDTSLRDALHGHMAAFIHQANTAYLLAKTITGPTRTLRSFLDKDGYLFKTNYSTDVSKGSLDRFVREQCVICSMESHVNIVPGKGLKLEWRKGMHGKDYLPDSAEVQSKGYPPRVLLRDFIQQYESWFGQTYGGNIHPRNLANLSELKQDLWNNFRLFVDRVQIRNHLTDQKVSHNVIFGLAFVGKTFGQ
eukprot:TRINITY_DN5932_c0_g1_i2.p1 TRINITY_DN5932_c0_g1~~TRINITY_DN5932_c0_g1_i2.p1  ORF type:complete len:501 (-),score=63.83 TRINITY_DN5932_c0_g1_i2:132-1634(-)